MKIATFNVNGITSRLPRLLEWLAEASPDIACLQELKTSDETFPIQALRDAGYGAIWHGQKGFNGVAILAKGSEPQETRRGLPGDPDDTHSRYLEARIGDLLIASIYLLIMVAVALIAIFYTPYSTSHTGVGPTYQGPSRAHPLGLDNLGRDILSRLMVGVQISLVVGVGCSRGALV